MTKLLSLALIALFLGLVICSQENIRKTTQQAVLAQTKQDACKLADGSSWETCILDNGDRQCCADGCAGAQCILALNCSPDTGFGFGCLVQDLTGVASFKCCASESCDSCQ